MPKKKKKSSKKYNLFTAHLIKKEHVISTFIVFVVCMLTGVFLYQAYELHKVETEGENEVNSLPQDIKHQLRVATPSASFRIPVLMYHYVEYVKDKTDKTRQLLDVEPYIFDEQVKTLTDAGYTFLTAKDMADIIDGIKPVPEKPIVLTFDDGHWDLDTDVLPILKKYHAVATAYIIPGFIGGSDFLTEHQLKDVAKSGLVEIGAHTVHHVYLKGVSYQEAKEEITDSKTILEHDLHQSVVSFAYPYGAFDLQAADLVKQAGFRDAVSTVPGIEASNTDRFYIFRLRPGNRVGQELLTFLEQTNFSPY